MKSSKEVVVKNGFQTFKLVLEVESAEEARALYAIFNYRPNAKLFPDGAEDITDKLHEYRILDEHHIIANGITYSDFYRAKKEERI